MLCIARALEGGESDIASSHNVYNILMKERPDVLETLISPTWYLYVNGSCFIAKKIPLTKIIVTAKAKSAKVKSPILGRPSFTLSLRAKVEFIPSQIYLPLQPLEN